MTSFSYETTLVPLTLLIALGWVVGRWRSIDVRPISTLVMFGKYILWAVAVAAFVWFDMHVLKLYGASVYAMIAILVVTPSAANTAVFAAQHDFKPQQAATVVFLTTLLSFTTLPFTLPLLFTFVSR